VSTSVGNDDLAARGEGERTHLLHPKEETVIAITEEMNVG
jgi:hypothetical protein